ncbi:MAG: type I-E CRISPR-associated endoribonuclease Cas2e [Pseudomonadota bacterium]
MLVMTLEKVPTSLRGLLSRWLVELQTGVFVGKVSPVVRDLLWEKALDKGSAGRCSQAWRTQGEQGFALRMHGDPARGTVDFDGIALVAVKNSAWRALDEAGAFRSLEDTSGG